MDDIEDFESCGVMSCVNRVSGPKAFKNYIIAETCRHALNNNCPYKRKVEYGNSRKVEARTV